MISVINAIAVFAFGVIFFVAPEVALKLFRTETYTATLFVARFFGGAMILAGVFIWLAKDLGDARMEKNMTIILLVSSVVGFILTLVGMVGMNVIRANGWIPLVIHILFALAYGYLVSGITVTASKRQ